ncbi:MAG TPA: hypothetical protein GX396_05065 [Tissierellia bacterium]|nr:hypothetical protein [Tissierellia bacterium]
MNKEERLLRIAELLSRSVLTNDNYIDKWLEFNNCKDLLSLIVKTKSFKKNTLRNIGDKRWHILKETYYSSDVYKELMKLMSDSHD